MVSVDPVEFFPGRVVVVVPHMDDCVLAVGGTIARLANKEHIHFIYATDGMGSPANGLIVPPGDIQRLSDAFGLLIPQPSLAARLGQAARKTVQARYSQDLVFNTHVSLFAQTMNFNVIGDRASC